MSYPIKFVAADMDGTLLDENSQLSPEFFSIFYQLSQRGILFAAASGRQYYSLIQTFESIKDQILFIAENGTLVMYKGQELSSSTIDKTDIERIIFAARAIDGAHIVLCGKKSAYIESESDQGLAEISKYYPRCQKTSDLLTVEDDFIKVAICHFSGTERWVLPAIEAAFGRSHKVVVSGKIWLDVMNAQASKGAAIEGLRGTFDFTYEQSMAFGDYLNDIEMLQACYHSYAMENAHPEVKRLARYVAKSNVDQGVLKALQAYLFSSD
jgi:Cof subfamily protein (haloacid dehalogenase superfamily)